MADNRVKCACLLAHPGSIVATGFALQARHIASAH
jgi:hypothetical protein